MAAASGMGRVFVGAIIAIFVGVLVAVALFPGITSGINSLTSGATPQVTGTSATLLGNVVLFVALGLMLFAVGFALMWLHGKGSLAFDIAKSINRATELVYNRATNTWVQSSENALTYNNI
jgi:hypothetical protein